MQNFFTIMSLKDLGQAKFKGPKPKLTMIDGPDEESIDFLVELSSETTLESYRSWPTDEGYSYRGETIACDKDKGLWVVDCISGGRDCDGQIDRETRFISKGGQTFSNDIYGVMKSELERVDSRQRDQYAELMGY